MPGKLESILIDEEWVSNHVSALDQNRRKELVTLRGFPDDKHQIWRVQPDIGWFMGKWIIPIRNIHGEVFHVKAWTNSPAINQDTGEHYEKWTTIGFKGAAHHRAQGNGIGQVFNLDWIVSWIDQQPASPSKPWLWFVEGEFDCLMLRCFNWPATTLTIGATSKLGSADLFIREFGGLASASRLLSHFAGIVLCYDADDAGVVGMQRHAIILEDLFKQIQEAANLFAHGKGEPCEPLPSTFVGIKAVDLRQHPAWEDGEGWGKDISDLIKWSLRNKSLAAKWLKDQARNSAAGIEAISDILGLEYDQDTGKPTIGEIMSPTFKTISFSELMRIGIDYAKHKGSRNEGWYHMAVTAARNGWTMDEMWYQATNDESDGLGSVLLEHRLNAIS